MLKISNVKIKADVKVNKEILAKKVGKILRVSCNAIKDLSIVKKSIDARDKENVFYLFSLKFDVENEDKYLKLKDVSKYKEVLYTIPENKCINPPIVVGFGPAGMFASLLLARAGANPIVLERGKAVEERQADIDKFFETGVLDTESNVQFGEGGAGTFSDGKLTTNTKDFRHSFILKTFVEFGAPEEILYEAKAHIGTDYLIKVVKNIREEIIRLGGTVLFDSKMTEVISENGTLTGVKYVNNGVEKEIKTNSLILAIGHSARDTFYSLKEQNIKMEQKPFAMGVRIEHKQDFISESQYGKFAKYLPPASYKLVAHLPNGRNVYTFCMCPGGVVVAASSEKERLAVNGMSYFARDKENANSALLVSIQPEDFGTDDVLGGVELQRKIEHSAYVEGGENYNAPVQKVGDFLKSQKTLELGDIKPSYKPAVTPSDFKNICPDYMYEALQEGIKTFDKQIKGFAQDNAIMTAVESRSSSPVRIVRNTDFNSVSIKGLYPCGEGCGYAGGIMSAATDGLKCGEAVLKGE